VARPSNTNNNPVANGSSVPAWPTLTPRGNPRRTRATTSCEVGPAGLSTRRTPSRAKPRPEGSFRGGSSPGGSLPRPPGSVIALLRRRGGQLRRDLLAQEGHELVVGQLGREAGRLPVTAAAARARDGRHVDLAVGRAQRDLLAPRRARVA